MQVRRVEIVRNFVARQIEANSENRMARRLVRLYRNENERGHFQRVEQQRGSRSGQRLQGSEEDLRIVGAIRRRNSVAGSRIGLRPQGRRRSILRVRVRSLSPNSSVLQTATASHSDVVNENNGENLRYYLCEIQFILHIEINIYVC